MKSIEVIYISGNGHSGSTLLDIILGTNHGFFSAGELTNVTRDSIFEEYCSCGEKIKHCNLWSQIIKDWNHRIDISFEEYKKLHLKYSGNKQTLKTLINLIKPSANFKKYVNATFQLYKTIDVATGAKVIIDSSKSPSRILVLRKIVDIKVIHLTRNFTGVLNSGKKKVCKDLSKGIEEKKFPRRTYKILLDWLLNNLLCSVFSIGIKSYNIKYNSFIRNQESLNIIHQDLRMQNLQTPVSTAHMLAGNRIRMNKKISIDTNIGTNYQHLNKTNLIFAKIVDYIFWFWT